MTRIIGLTGGISTGKTTVARMFEKLGALVIDADAIVHELQAPGSPILDAIATAFGADVIRPDGSLDRERLGKRVFRDPEARARLNRLMHPRVGAEMARRLAEARETAIPMVLLDIPLLFEGRRLDDGGPVQLGGSPRDSVEAVILVYAPEEAQVERQVARNGYDREEALRRVRAQLSIEKKRPMADYVIDNSGSLEHTQQQVRQLFERLCREASDDEVSS